MNSNVNQKLNFTHSVLEKLKNLIFHIPIIPQSLKSITREP